MNQTLILASNSPRRKQLLAELGFQFYSIGADTDESMRVAEPALAYVQRVAQDKAQAIVNQLSTEQRASTVILAADTCVQVQQQILGKPKSFADFQVMMRRLSGRQHQVLSAVVAQRDEQQASVVVSSLVDFKALTEAEITWYWQTGEPQDKAGGYGIQGLAARFVRSIKGSYTSIVGLPLVETAELLAQFELAPTLDTVKPATE
jgi:septum formation protein